MRYVAPGLVLLFLLAPPTAFSNTTLIDSWQYKDSQLNIVADFFTDGTFRQVNVGPQGRQTFSGRYQLNGQTLYLQGDGGRAAPRMIDGKAAGPMWINPWELVLQKNGDRCSCGMMNRVMTIEIANETSTRVT